MSGFVEGALAVLDTLSSAMCVFQTPFLPFDIHFMHCKSITRYMNGLKISLQYEFVLSF
jgi:hypothetical protein